MKLTHDGKLEPIWYALGGVVAVPICVVIVVLGAVLLLVAWPVAPFVMYAQRRKEITEAETRRKETRRKEQREAIEAILRGEARRMDKYAETWRGADL